MMSWIRSSRPLLAVLAIFGAAAFTRAEEVRVTVVAILASDRGNAVDKELKGIAEEIRKKEPTLTSFRLGQITCKSVTVGEKETFPLVGKEFASVIVKHGANEQNRVGLTVKPPQLGEITYTTCCGKFFPIVTRYQTSGKERLIIAIRVQPCKGK
jgi:hypothetical protein